eukprot:m.993 g.993  ORF g.993 m.993 type:complete len:637 (-) comp498_c0_seq1:312-2222(-)
MSASDRVQQTRVMLCSCNSHQSPLEVRKEFENIHAMFLREDTSPTPAALETQGIHVFPPVVLDTPKELAQALSEADPHILVLAGYGACRQLMFPAPLSDLLAGARSTASQASKAIESILKEHVSGGGALRLVVLNCCESSELARDLARGDAPVAAIGASGIINNTQARTFSSVFLDNLLNNNASAQASMEVALQGQGRSAVDAAGIDMQPAYVLFGNPGTMPHAETVREEARTAAGTVVTNASDPGFISTLLVATTSDSPFGSGTECNAIYRCRRMAPLTVFHETALQVTLSDVFELVNWSQPQVVTFSTHAQGTKLQLAASSNNPRTTVWVEARDIAPALRNVKCVVMNTMAREMAAQELHQAGIPFVIFCADRLKDDAAIKFSSTFHEMLYKGQGIRASFDAARHASGDIDYRMIAPDGADDSVVVRESLLSPRQQPLRESKPTLSVLLEAAGGGSFSAGSGHELNLIRKTRCHAARFKDIGLEMLLAGSVNQLQETMEQFQPQVVHFTGHGVKRLMAFTQSYAVLEEPERMADILPLLANVKCVVLHCCYGAEAAQILHERAGIPFVVYHTDRVLSDEKSKAFAETFYAMLFAGSGIHRSFAAAQLQSNDMNYHLLATDDTERTLGQDLGIEF